MDPITELLRELDEIYPLPDDSTRAARAQRTSDALKRFMWRETEAMSAIARKVLEQHIAKQSAAPTTKDGQ